jgi:hypothetical protein
MIIDLKVNNTKDLKDFDLLRYDAKEQAFVPFSKDDLIKLFGFNLQEIKTEMRNLLKCAENQDKKIGVNDRNIQKTAKLVTKMALMGKEE